MSKNKFTSSVVPTRPTTQQSSDGLSIIITGSAKPHRMSSFGPKPLFTVNNMALIDYILPILSNAFPKAEIVLTVGYEADKLIKKFSGLINIVENQLFETTNLVEEIRLAINTTVNKKILILDSDILFDKNLFNKVKFDQSFILVDEEQLSEDEVGVIISENNVTNFSFGLQTKWCGISYLAEKESNILRNIVNDRKNSTLYLFEAFNTLINRGGKFHPITVENSKINKINSAKELRNENINQSR
jgi:CTP:phosphocholine cytidylyltransferase-like protein